MKILWPKYFPYPLQKYDQLALSKKEYEYDELRGMSKETNIKHFKLKKFFGFRYHYIPEMDSYEFLPAYLIVNYSPKPMQLSIHGLKLFIPFMKHNHGITIAKDTRDAEIIHDNFKRREIKKLRRIRITFF